MFISPTQRAIHFGNQDENPQVRKTYPPLHGDWGRFTLDGDTYFVELKNPHIEKSWKKAFKHLFAAKRLEKSEDWCGQVWVKSSQHQRKAPHEERHPHKPNWTKRTSNPQMKAVYDSLMAVYHEICRPWVALYEENALKQPGFNKATEDEFLKEEFRKERETERKKCEQATHNAGLLSADDTAPFVIAEDL
ncbi:MAG TPA: hypothetical protein V6C52_09340 [Coleofasciculaceae cyanobacterium]|jgi:hypothetical protein